jgi:hypothetical protein
LRGTSADIGALRTRVYSSVMGKLPPGFRQEAPELYALVGELAMWIAVHHISGDQGSADVLAPLCSAVLDCFADGAKSMRLEQPPALTARHLCASSRSRTC